MFFFSFSKVTSLQRKWCNFVHFSIAKGATPPSAVLWVTFANANYCQASSLGSTVQAGLLGPALGFVSWSRRQGGTRDWREVRPPLSWVLHQPELPWEGSPSSSVENVRAFVVQGLRGIRGFKAETTIFISDESEKAPTQLSALRLGDPGRATGVSASRSSEFNYSRCFLQVESHSMCLCETGLFYSVCHALLHFQRWIMY